jgi:hypothetical protein
MPDNPRMPGHPSDIPSSRSSEGSGNIVIPGPPGPPQYNQPSPGSSGNNQTRNIIIGAIATVIASTTVYYLTQYVNNKKTDSIPNQLVMKEVNTSAWKRYVSIDNLYYKNLIGLISDEQLAKNIDNYKAELQAETEKFINDAELLIKDKHIDNTFVTMINRRVKRERESTDIRATLIDNIKRINQSKINEREKQKQRFAEVTSFLTHSTRLYKMAANEIEDLSKTLTETYSTRFDPNDVLIYADYKKSASAADSIRAEVTDSAAYYDAKTVKATAHFLIGNWISENNKISLQENGSVSFSLDYGEEATGSWKIEDNKLRIDALSSVTKTDITWLFYVRNVTPNSFSIKLSTSPFTKSNFTRVKDQ